MFRSAETNLRKKYGLLTWEDEEELDNEIAIQGGRARKMTVLDRPTTLVKKFDRSTTNQNSFDAYIMEQYTTEFQAFLVKVKTSSDLKNLVKEDKKWLKLVKSGGMEQSFKAKICTDHFNVIFKKNDYPIKCFLNKFVKYIRGIIRYMCELLFAKIDKFMKDYYEIPDKLVDAVVKNYNDNFLKGLEKFQFPLGEMKKLIGGHIHKANGRDVIRLLKTHRCSDEDQTKLLKIRETFLLRRLPLIDPNLALPYTISPYENAIKILGGLGKSFKMDVSNLMTILERAYNSIFDDINRNLGDNASVNDTDLSLVIAYCVINCDVHKIPAWLEYVRAHIPKHVEKEEEEKKMISLLFCFVMKWFMEEVAVKIDMTKIVKKKEEEVVVPVPASITPISLMSRRVVKKGGSGGTVGEVGKRNQQSTAASTQVVRLGGQVVKPVRSAPSKPVVVVKPAVVKPAVVKPAIVKPAVVKPVRAPTKPPRETTTMNASSTVVKLGGRNLKPGRAAPPKPGGEQNSDPGSSGIDTSSTTNEKKPTPEPKVVNVGGSRGSTVVKLGGRSVKPGRAAPVKPPTTPQEPPEVEKKITPNKPPSRPGKPPQQVKQTEVVEKKITPNKPLSRPGGKPQQQVKQPEVVEKKITPNKPPSRPGKPPQQVKQTEVVEKIITPNKPPSRPVKPPQQEVEKKTTPNKPPSRPSAPRVRTTKEKESTPPITPTTKQNGEDEFPEEELLEEEDLEEVVTLTMPEESSEVISKTVSVDDLKEQEQQQQQQQQPGVEEEFEEEEIEEEDLIEEEDAPNKPSRPGRPAAKPGRPAAKPGRPSGGRKKAPAKPPKRKSGERKKAPLKPPKRKSGEREKPITSTTTSNPSSKPNTKPLKPASKPTTKPLKPATKPTTKPTTKPKTTTTSPTTTTSGGGGKRPPPRPGKNRRSGRLSNIDVKRPPRPRSTRGIGSASTPTPTSSSSDNDNNNGSEVKKSTTTKKINENNIENNKQKITTTTPNNNDQDNKNIDTNNNNKTKPSRPPKPGAPPSKPGAPPSKPRNINPADRTKRLNQARRRSLVYRKKKTFPLFNGGDKPVSQSLRGSTRGGGGVNGGKKTRSESLSPLKKPAKPPGKSSSSNNNNTSTSSKQPPSIPLRSKKRASGSGSPLSFEAEEKKELVRALTRLKKSLLTTTSPISSGGDLKFEYNGPKSQIADLCKEIIVDLIGEKLKNTK